MDDTGPLHRKRGCLGALLGLLRMRLGGEAETARLPYRRKDYLLTRAERAFYDVLVEAVGGDVRGTFGQLPGGG